MANLNIDTNIDNIDNDNNDNNDNKNDNNDKNINTDDIIASVASSRLQKIQEDYDKYRKMVLKSGIPLIISELIKRSKFEDNSFETLYINMYFLDELTLTKKTDDFYNDMTLQALKKGVKKTTLIENIQSFNKNILNNIFLNEFSKKNISKIFYKSTRIYFLLGKLIRRFKCKKYKINDVNTDLCLNPLEEIDDKFKISIMENNTVYHFRITDLLNIVKRALSNYDDICIINPIPVKNPYTNLPLSKSNLYNIFFKTMNTGFLMPILFHKYFLCNFELKQFSIENDTYLMNLAINDYVSTSGNYEIYQEILGMLEYYKRNLIKKVDLYKFIEKKNT